MESILCRNWYKKKRQKHIFQFPTVYMYIQYNILISVIIDFKEQTWIFITKISKINILVEHPVESINFHFEKHASAIHIILHNTKRISRIRCICCSCHIKSPQNRGLSHHSDATNYDLNCNSATHKHLYERLTTFCTIYKGPKMNRSWLFVCFATLRLLQCFTTTCQLQFVMLCHYFNYTLYIKYLCFRPQSTMDAAHRFLHSTMSTEERRKLSVWIPPLTLPIACNMEHMIAWAPHIHSHGHTFNRPIT